ncbi:hypothetical protein TNCV_2237411 [Trichonephila clavipes]|nr:hypothetical protein TNCV_2237411 [Trichonephila clavipes]
MPPNTLRVHTEYRLGKSVGPEALWAVAAETTSAGGRRIFPSLQFHAYNIELEIGGVAAYHKEVQPVSQALATFIPSLRWYWARTHDMPAMIRYFDHWAAAAPQ